MEKQNGASENHRRTTSKNKGKLTEEEKSEIRNETQREFCVKTEERYGDYRHTPYLVPDLYFSKDLGVKKDRLLGQSVFVEDRSLDRETPIMRGDVAMKHVHANWRALAHTLVQLEEREGVKLEGQQREDVKLEGQQRLQEGEGVKQADVRSKQASGAMRREYRRDVTFTIFDLNFKDVLNKQGLYGKVIQYFPLPRDKDYTFKLPSDKQGDFDVVSCSRWGVLLGEVKAIGKPVVTRGGQLDQPVEMTVSDLVKKLAEALDQAAKEERMGRHLLHDILPPGVPVRVCLFLPYISRQQVREALNADATLMKVG